MFGNGGQNSAQRKRMERRQRDSLAVKRWMVMGIPVVEVGQFILDCLRLKRRPQVKLLQIVGQVLQNVERERKIISRSLKRASGVSLPLTFRQFASRSKSARRSQNAPR
jgi:hypothetical protein